MASSTQEWIDELKQISVLELSERIKALEEEFGVSAAAVAAAAPAGGGGAAEAAEPEEEQSAFDVIVTSAGEKKIQVIKVVRAATGLGLKEAKALVDEAPKPVKEGIGREEADKLVSEIESRGGAHDLDHLDLLVARAGEHHVDGARLLLRRGAVTGAGGYPGRSRSGDRGGRDAELLLERLDPLGQLEHGDALELVDPFLCVGGHLVLLGFLF